CENGKTCVNGVCVDCVHDSDCADDSLICSSGQITAVYRAAGTCIKNWEFCNMYDKSTLSSKLQLLRTFCEKYPIALEKPKPAHPETLEE
ncbi:11214_t:CDS:2, partial [Acaulospora morrowiae]